MKEKAGKMKSSSERKSADDKNIAKTERMKESEKEANNNIGINGRRKNERKNIWKISWPEKNPSPTQKKGNEIFYFFFILHLTIRSCGRAMNKFRWCVLFLCWIDFCFTSSLLIGYRQFSYRKNSLFWQCQLIVSRTFQWSRLQNRSTRL